MCYFLNHTTHSDHFNYLYPITLLMLSVTHPFPVVLILFFSMVFYVPLIFYYSIQFYFHIQINLQQYHNMLPTKLSKNILVCKWQATFTKFLATSTSSSTALVHHHTSLKNLLKHLHLREHCN